MKLAVVGAGYVGLTSAACLARLGHDVVLIDIDAKRIAMLQQGEIPIFEPGLQQLVSQAVADGRLNFANDLIAARKSQIGFITVGTPSREDGSTDLSFVQAATRGLAAMLGPRSGIVVKSTVPVGTSRALARLLAAEGHHLPVGSNPEFLREGSAISDFLKPDRIVIGGDNERLLALLAKVYAPLVAQGVPLISTTAENAELVKYAANAFLALKVGFINELADLCEASGADIEVVAHGAGTDRRIGNSFFKAGPGFGGSCFPKDLRALAHVGRAFAKPLRLIETLIKDNETRKRDVAGRILTRAKAVGARRIAILGTAFKAETDDIRESPALPVLSTLAENGYDLQLIDPQAQTTTSRVFGSGTWHECPYECAKGADLVVIMTDWPSFASLDVERIGRSMRRRILMDMRNVITPARAVAAGFEYHGIGRRSLTPEGTGSAPVHQAIAAAPPTR